MGAEVVVFDRKRARLVDMRALGNNVTALYPYTDALQREIARADLVIGAVLQTGGRAPQWRLSPAMIVQQINRAVFQPVCPVCPIQQSDLV